MKLQWGWERDHTSVVREAKRYLDAAVQTHRGEAAVVFGVELHGHDDVHMTFVSLGVRGERLSDADKTEVVVPIPQLDQHIVSARQNVGERFVDIDSTNVVVMRLPFFHLKLMTENSDYFFSCVVVVDTDFQVVASKDDPLLSRDELAAANGKISRLKVIANFLLFEVVNDHFSREHAQQSPGLDGMEVNAFYTVALLQHGQLSSHPTLHTHVLGYQCSKRSRATPETYHDDAVDSKESKRD